jgi:uncharacterized protein (TIGR02599 family)
MVLMVSLTDQVQNVYRRTQAKTEQFGKAREAFESITRKLSQATLNTYWDYDYDTSNNPKKYKRQSELRFIIGQASTLVPDGSKSAMPTHGVFFQAPFGDVDAEDYRGLENLLNTWGYYIEFGSDEFTRPLVLTGRVPLKYRYRLYELRQASDKLGIYTYTSGKSAYKGMEWFQDPLKIKPPIPRPVRVVAENVVALILTAKDPEQVGLASDYIYDTSPTGDATREHQLPPMVQVTMVVIDEASALRLAAKNGTSAPVLLDTAAFETADKFDADLKDLKDDFVKDGRVNYRIFSSNVSIRGAKWSREPKAK